MGSFNVACSISHLSIGPGEKCYFLPLIRNKYGSIDTQSNLISNEGPSYFFWPFCFPIEGEYNDYGGMEELVHNANTKVIEKFVGITIEQFVECLTGRRGFNDYFSEIHENFAKVKGNKFSRNISSELMFEIGFEEYSNQDAKYIEDSFEPFAKTYRFQSHEFYVVLIEDFANKTEHYTNYKCIISDLNDKKIKSGRFSQFDDFMNLYKEATGYFLNYENQKLVNLLENLSGTFIKKEVYDYLASIQMDEYNANQTFESTYDANEYMIKLLGFKFEKQDSEIDRYNKVYRLKGEDNYFVGSDGTWSHFYDQNKKEVANWTYHPNGFVKEWNKLSDVKIKIPDKLVGKRYGDILFDEISSTIKANDKNEKMDGIIQKLKISKYLYGDELREFGYRVGFSGQLCDHKIMKMYREAIKKKSVKKDFADFYTFYNNCYTLNKLLIPWFNGCQCGANKASVKFASEVAKIGRKDLKKKR